MSTRVCAASERYPLDDGRRNGTEHWRDSTPLVRITKAKLIDLRTSLKEREEPIGNATINTLFASLSAGYSYFIEQGWCSENPGRRRDRTGVGP